MKKLMQRFGRYNVIAIGVMITGVLLFLLTPLLLRLFNYDTDIIGVLVFLAGLILLTAGAITRFIINKTRAGKA